VVDGKRREKLIYANATDHFKIGNGRAVTFEYNERRDRTVSDYRFCSKKTGLPFGSFVQRMLRDIGEAARIVETLDNWR
jgi:hypothetical protein